MNKYVVRVYQDDDPCYPYEEWANDRDQVAAIVGRIRPLLRDGDSMTITEAELEVPEELWSHDG